MTRRSSVCHQRSTVAVDMDLTGLFAVLIWCSFGTVSLVDGSPRTSRDENDVEEPLKPKNSQPNIIVIVGDDVGWNDVPWHNRDIKSPYLANLANSGIRLNQSYLLPSCSPSRAALLTGVYPYRSGMQGEVIQSTYPIGLPLKYPTIANELKNLGYSTHAIGKWNQGFCHWNYTPTYRGFDTFFGFYQAVEHFYLHNSYVNASEIQGRTGYDLRNNTDVAWEYYGQHNSIPFVKQALHLINTHDTSKPFFLYYASPYCHIPHEVPRHFEDIYNNSNVHNIFRRGFMARFSALDHDIERIIEAFKRKGLYENSVIAFTSDNGGSVNSGGCNYPLRGGKMSLYEGGTRVPGFFHSPNLIKKGFDYNGMMHGVDWLPTLLSIAGGKAGRDLDGISLWEAIINNKASPRKQFFYNIVERGPESAAAIRKDQWKLIVGRAGVPRSWYSEEDITGHFVDSYFEYEPLEFDPTNINTTQLYNLEDDPSERNDLSAELPDKVNELMALIDQGRLESVPYIQKDEDPAGDPEFFGGAFTPGWCDAIIEPHTRSWPIDQQLNIPLA